MNHLKATAVTIIIISLIVGMFRLFAMFPQESFIFIVVMIIIALVFGIYYMAYNSFKDMD